ncbi:MAG: Asp-tRNA(Asn)/Glu-tRNA(Gln) amidotransferase subunit GatC [Bacilli bacterium]|nr:Asp-tRNA(Asn)/Glu-tRNA(Gln) amidotransferase subunit GatC [Bacilli bacterium]
MDKLTEEEVMHVAKLARIEISKEELEKYQVSLKKIFAEIEKIKEIEIEGDILISPTSSVCPLESITDSISNPKEILANANDTSGNYIKVPVVIDHE